MAKTRRLPEKAKEQMNKFYEIDEKKFASLPKFYKYIEPKPKKLVHYPAIDESKRPKSV